jgi:hypothetical protein
VRDRTADGVDRRVANDEVEIGAMRTQGIVAGRADLRAGLPPPVLAADDARIQRGVDACPCPDTPFGRFNAASQEGRCDETPQKAFYRSTIALFSFGTGTLDLLYLSS